MGSTKIKLQSAKSVLETYGTHQQELSSAIGLIRSVKSYRCISGKGFMGIYRSLDKVISRLEDEKAGIKTLEKGLSDVLRTYERYENTIAGEIKAEKAEEKNSISNLILYPQLIFPFIPMFPHTSWHHKWFDYKNLELSKLFWENGKNKITSVLEEVLKKSSFAKNIEKDMKDDLKGFTDTHSKTFGQKMVYDAKNNTWVHIDSDDKDAVKKFSEQLSKTKIEQDVILAAGGGSAASSLLSGQASGDWGWGSGTVKSKAGEWNLHANGSIGIGNAQGSAGASVTAFTAEEELQLGNDNMGAYVKSTQTIGRASAKAEGRAGLVDENGNFDPALYGGVNLEAIAGEITGAAGVKILGSDIGIKGSLNYGVGAHANIGYRDGKLSIDVGATIGVGGSIKLDIDVSGTVNAVVDSAKSFIDGVAKFFRW